MGLGMNANEGQSVNNYQRFTQIKQNMYASTNGCVDLESYAKGK
jgi:hypothetical protein